MAYFTFVFRREYLEVPHWFWNIISGDMAIHAIVASKGSIKAFPEIMSTYRKHPGGITSAADVRSSFHQKRIELMEYLDEYLQGQFHDPIESVKASHRAGLNPPLRKRLRRRLGSFVRQIV